MSGRLINMATAIPLDADAIGAACAQYGEV